jgi:radical SAM superfamily enzyme YgiQ (UPF0313 family)
MKVLLLSTNTLPASPSGPAYVAGALRQAGHEVSVFENLFAADLENELAAAIHNFQPDVVGVSIRLVFGGVQDPAAPLGTRHIDLRPRVRDLVGIVRRTTPAPIVLGGPGFNYYARDWLNYLDLQYGIRGEGEIAFPLFLQRLATGGDLASVPGCVVRGRDGLFSSTPPAPIQDLNDLPLPAYDLFDLPRYAERGVTPAILTKRGCAFACTYCPYAKLEGKRYRLKSPQRVLDEARHILAHAPGRRVIFCDNNFNAPPRHAENMLRGLIAAGADFEWGTGDLRPTAVTDDFCRLMADSGCYYTNLSIESASDTMLRRMQRGYTVRHVRRALEVLSRSRIPFGASLMFGAPGETPETIAETLRVVEDYDIPLGVWVTIGVFLWTDLQEIVGEARRAGTIADDAQLFEGAVYLSPELPRSYLAELPQRLRARPGYTVQFNKPYADWTLAGAGLDQ